MTADRPEYHAKRAREAIGAGRDLYRRGAMAVARSGGDNGALILLAGTAAVAAVSWFALRRRRGSDA